MKHLVTMAEERGATTTNPKMMPRQHIGTGNSIEIPMQKRSVRMCGTRKRWWGAPGNRDHPTIFCMFRTSSHLLFCTGISMSCRVIGMLLWHHFRCSCRGTPFVPPWWPNAPYHIRCQHFHKNCIKLDYVIRIMLTTFKWLKLCLL